jgi:hypothetical protein
MDEAAATGSSALRRSSARFEGWNRVEADWHRPPRAFRVARDSHIPLLHPDDYDEIWSLRDVRRG